MTIRLVQCDARGEPLENLGPLPPALKENCAATAKLFDTIGFAPPWIGYVTTDDTTPVGGCAFVGAPKDDAVEIAYYTLTEFEGRGFSTQAVARLIETARNADPGVRLTAKTLPEENASTKILRRNGFTFAGETSDDDIGLAWAWELSSTHATARGDSLEAAVRRVCAPDSIYWLSRTASEGEFEAQHEIEVRLDLNPRSADSFVAPSGWRLAHRKSEDGAVFLRRVQPLTDDALREMFAQVLALAERNDGRFHSWLHGSDLREW